MPRKMNLRKNDQVLVIAGRDRGTTGKVLKVFPADGTVIVERVNLVKKHTRANPQRQVQGGILEREAPILASKVMVLDPDSGKPTRVGRKRLADGKAARVAKKSGAMLN
ncbi:MAG: 50S ribosomal protein L24 [Thermoanaerobaculia bacterium]